MQQLRAAVNDGQNLWVPRQNLPFQEIILFAYAADRTPRSTYICLPAGLVHARSGRVVERRKSKPILPKVYAQLLNTK